MYWDVCVCDPASGVRAIYRREGFHSLQKDLPKVSLKCCTLQCLQERVWIPKLSCSDATFKMWSVSVSSSNLCSMSQVAATCWRSVWHSGGRKVRASVQRETGAVCSPRGNFERKAPQKLLPGVVAQVPLHRPKPSQELRHEEASLDSQGSGAARGSPAIGGG